MDPFVPCRLMKLPAHQQIEAARSAIAINPSNAPVNVPELIPEPKEDGGEEAAMPRMLRLALRTSKWWGAGGVKLGVSFMDNPPADLRARILSHANAWSRTANVQFSESSQGEIRLARQPGQGYYSYLGPDCLQIPAGQPTLNLDSFTMQTEDSEFYRVVRHEFGHALGFIHEHMRRQIVQRIDPAKAIAFFGATQGWTAQEVQEQVLTPYEDTALKETPSADTLSVMCYSLPGSIMVDGLPVPGGTDIDANDYSLVATLYPRSTTPTPTPTPPPVGPGPLLTLTFAQAVARGRVVQFVAKVVIPAGNYGLTPLSPGHETMPHTSAFDV